MSQPSAISASTQSDSHSADLRARIVGILSDTANGCLSELGYFPGLLKKLQELERLNVQWKEENVKLFQDNRTLAQMTRRHEERLKEATAKPPDNTAKIGLLEEQIKALSIQNAELKKTNDALVNSSKQCNNPAHQHLIADHQHLVSIYHAAMNEIQHLRQMVASSAATVDHYRYHNQLMQASALPSPEPQAPAALRLVQPYTPSQMSYSPSIPMGVHPSISVAQNTMQPTRPSIQHMQQRKANFNVVQPAMPPSQPVQKVNGPIPRISGNFSPQPSPTSPTSSIQRMHESQYMMPPPKSIAQPISTQYHRKTSLTIQTSASSTPVMPSRPPQTFLPDNAQHPFDGPNRAIASPRSPYPNPTPEKEPPSRSASVSRPPSQPTSQHASPRVPSLVPASYKSSSPPDSASVTTPISGVTDTFVEVASSPLVVAEQMKRMREEISSDLSDAESGRKRARVDEADETVEMVQDSRTDEDSSEQEIIEIDSDGLRSVSSCLSELMENSPNGPEWQICRLCDVRYKNGLISEAPKPFLRASQEQLVQHLTTDHNEAWETLRGDV